MFLALRDLRRGARRFVLLGVVIALVAFLSTVLSGLATGLVSDGISGLRALPLDHLAFQPDAEATFSRSTLREDALARWDEVEGVDATPIGVSFVNALAQEAGPTLDLALVGVAPDSFLLTRPEARAAIAGDPGLVLSESLADEGVEVGDHYFVAGSTDPLPVLGFTGEGTYGHVDLAYTSLATWQALTYGAEPDGRFSAIALHGTDDVDVAAVDEGAGTETMTKAEAYAGSPGYSAETITMTLIRSFLLVISALVIGAFFTVLTVQRTRQIGLLKAMGASDAYVVRDGIGQMLVLVCLATAVGALVGAGAVALMGRGEAPVELSLPSVATSALALVVAGVLGSLVALRRITRIEPAIALGADA